MKRYIANSHISISVYYPNGTSKHVSFEAKTGGGSVYYSDDPTEQAALESHSKFGRLFKLDSYFNSEPEVVIVRPEETFTEEVSTNSKLITINVTDLAAAKDYLCDRFGLSRTKLRSRASILEAAEQNNIIFEGI